MAGYNGVVARERSFKDTPVSASSNNFRKDDSSGMDFVPEGAGSLDGRVGRCPEVTAPTGNARILFISSWTASDDAMDRTEARRLSSCMRGEEVDDPKESPDELCDEGRDVVDVIALGSVPSAP